MSKRKLAQQTVGGIAYPRGLTADLRESAFIKKCREVAEYRVTKYMLLKTLTPLVLPRELVDLIVSFLITSFSLTFSIERLSPNTWQVTGPVLSSQKQTCLSNVNSTPH